MRHPFAVGRRRKAPPDSVDLSSGNHRSPRSATTMENLLDTEMDLLSPTDVTLLCRERSGPCVSIFMPTHRLRHEERQDRLRFQHLLANAAEKLAESAPHIQADNILAEAQWLLGNSAEFWRHQADTLAVFMAPGETYWYRLPMTVQEHLSVGDTFHVYPLIALLNASGHFFALALSSDKTRLFEGSRYQLHARDLDDTPTSLSEATRNDVYQPYLQMHTGVPGMSTGNGRTVIFHGHGEAADRALYKMRLTEFLQGIDNGVRRAIGPSKVPLVLVGLDAIVGAYRTVNHYRHVLDTGVSMNPRDLSLSELHDHVWSVVAPTYEEAQKGALEEFSTLSGQAPERISVRLEEIHRAAEHRRIKTLFVPSDERIPYQVDHNGKGRKSRLDQTAKDASLLDSIVARSYRYGGHVFVVGSDEMPGARSAAAIFRY